MNITIIPNDGNPEIHKSGCADISRYHRDRRHAEPTFSTTVETKEDAAVAWWSDLIDEGSMTATEAIGYCDFKPCAKALR